VLLLESRTSFLFVGIGVFYLFVLAVCTLAVDGAYLCKLLVSLNGLRFCNLSNVVFYELTDYEAMGVFLALLLS